jgi:hypothetical protein
MATGEQEVKVKFTGNTTDLDRAAKKAERDITGLSRVGKGIKNLFAIDKIVDGLRDLPKQIGNFLSSGGIYIAAGIAAAIAIGAPVIGAAVSSAVLLGLGGGVLALGIKSALADPKVAKAFDGLKKKASAIFKDFGKPFVDPMVRAAKTIGKVLDDLKPQILQLGRIMAPVIDKLSPALAQFFKAVMPGITKAVAASVPLFNTLAAKLPAIGRAISIFFDEISQNGDGANMFFSDLLGVIEKLIVGLGVAIGKLAGWYAAIRNFIGSAKARFLEFQIYVVQRLGKILDAAYASLGWIPGIGSKLKAAKDKFHQFQVDANKELAKIKNRNVYVKVFSNIWSVINDISNAFAKLKDEGKLGKRASGGPVSAGKSYLVGEKGPEILTMGSGGGYITPNHKLGNGDSPTVQVFIGDKELEQIAYTVVQQTNRQLNRQLRARTT